MTGNGSVEKPEGDASPPLDLLALRYEALEQRPSKVSLAHLGRPGGGEAWFADWLDSLPKVLGAQALVRLADAIVSTTAAKRPVIAALGGHVVKTGCGVCIWSIGSSEEF